MSHTVHIVRWQPQYAADFVRLNKEWIETYFELEPSDLKIFKSPEQSIIAKGGEIFFAVDEQRKVLGCCALVYHPEDGRYELAKMAVSPQAQGQGIGYQLGMALLKQARSQGVKSLFLEANTRLEASIRLYRKLGFLAVPMQHPAYSRCNLYMELDL